MLDVSDVLRPSADGEWEGWWSRRNQAGWRIPRPGESKSIFVHLFFLFFLSVSFLLVTFSMLFCSSLICFVWVFLKGLIFNLSCIQPARFILYTPFLCTSDWTGINLLKWSAAPYRFTDEGSRSESLGSVSLTRTRPPPVIAQRHWSGFSVRCSWHRWRKVFCLRPAAKPLVESEDFPGFHFISILNAF